MGKMTKQLLPIRVSRRFLSILASRMYKRKLVRIARDRKRFITRERAYDNQNIRYVRRETDLREITIVQERRVKAEESRDRALISGQSIAPSATRASNGHGVTTRVICLRNFTGSARGSSYSLRFAACPPAMPPSRPSKRLVASLHVSFARTLVAAPQVCACKSQREVVTTGSPRAGWTRTLWPPGSPTRMRVRPPWRVVNLFAKKKILIERQRHSVTARYSLTLSRKLLAIDH